MKNMKINLLFLLISSIIVASGCNRTGTGSDYSTPPFIIDSHMHYKATDEWEKSFLDIYTKHNAMACLLMNMKDLDRGIAFAKAHPDRVIPYAQVDIESPTVVEDIQKVYAMGFKGLGELFASGRWDYNDPKYDTVWALAEKLGMPYTTYNNYEKLRKRIIKRNNRHP